MRDYAAVVLVVGGLSLLALSLIGRALSVAESGSCTVEASSPADRYHVRLDRPTPCDVRELLLEARDAIESAIEANQAEAVNADNQK